MNFSVTRSTPTLTLLKLMLPILLTQAAQAGYGLVDTVMAGQVSADDLAVVAIGAGIWLPVFLFTLGVLIATTPLLGELIGQKNLAKVPYLIQQSLWFALFCGILSAGVLFALSYSFQVFDVPAHLQADTRLYLQSVALGFPAVALYTSLRCYSESLGLAHPVTVISITGVLLDIPLNYVFIYGKFGMPALGGAGCGVATAIVMWLTLFMLAAYLAVSKNYAQVRFYQRFSRPQLASIKKIAVLGLPIGTAIFFEASLFSIAAVVLSPLGAVIVASHQVALSVTSQLFMVPLSLALALTIVISRYYGEADWEALKRMQRIGFMFATGFAMLSMLVILSSRHLLAGFFTTDAAVVQLATQLLLIAAVYQLVDAWQVTAAGILRGIQDTAAPMWITFISYWCVALPLGVYLSRFTDYGAKGFWFALIVGLSLAAVLLIHRIIYQNKKLAGR